MPNSQRFRKVGMPACIESVRISVNKPESFAIALRWCSTPTEMQTAKDWFTDPRPCKAYIYGSAKEELGIVLLSRMNTDPQGKHAKPWLVNFLIVSPCARRKGIATALASKICAVDEATAFCSSDVSEQAFVKAGFYSHGVFNRTAMVRTV